MDLFGEEPKPEPAAPAIDYTTPDVPQEVFTHPRNMELCLGHGPAEHNLLEMYNSGRLPHGFVFSGLKGIGKATFAFRFAKFLLKHGTGGDPNQDNMFADEPATPETMDVNADDQCVRLVESGAHPDLLCIEREYDASKNRYKGQVAVASIRKVNPFLRMTASEGGWRIVIIDDADTMNRNAQNALLKILEEPPKNTVLILITHRAGALVPTIKSRTQAIHFQPLSDENMSTLLRKAQPLLSDQECQTLIELSGNSFGQAINLIEDGGLEVLSKTLSLFDTFPNVNWPEIHQFADELSRNGQDARYAVFGRSMVWIYEQLIQTKARGIEIQASVLKTPVFEEMLKHSSLETLLKTCDNLRDHFDKVEFANLDKRQGVIGAFTIIQP